MKYKAEIILFDEELAAFLETEKSFRKIMGHRDLWAFKAILEGSQLAIRQEIA